MVNKVLLKLYRKCKYVRLAIHRRLYVWEMTNYYKGRLHFRSSHLFEEYFKVFLDDSKSQIEIGEESFFKDYCSIVAYDNGIIKIGRHVFFNQYCSINALDAIEIGDDCLFGENVHIYDHNHRYKEPTLIRNQGYSKKPIQIGSNCWIGSNVTILKGVAIGDNCVIGAGTVVYKSIQPNSIITSQTVL